MAEREVRYCTTEDGVRIAYCVEGEGPALLVCPMLVESFSLDSLDRVEFTSRLGAGRSLIRYDMRGTGLSQRDVSQVSLDTMLTDLRAVVQVVGRPVSIWGDTGSGLTAIKYAAETAGSLDALILYGAYARPLDFLTRESMDAFATLAEANWQVAARTFADLGDAPPENGLVWAQSASGTVVAELLRSAIDADVSPFLSKITARTLVINRLDDIFCPISVAQGLAAKIRNVRLVTPPGL
jgi:pimeloyl-ACP methyl ester carboxylesterase